MGMVEVTSVITLISWTIVMVVRYVQSVTAYKVIPYQAQSTANTAPWRWRRPDKTLGIQSELDVSLEIKDGETVSSLFLHQRFNIGECLVHLMGYMFAGLGMSTLLGCLVQSSDGSRVMALVGAFLFLGFAALCLSIGDQVIKIDLYENRMEIMTKYALFLYRKKRYTPKKNLKIRGSYQSFLSFDRSQQRPDYKLMINQSFLGMVWKQRTFFLTCNQTQGSWIISGLEDWNQNAMA